MTVDELRKLLQAKDNTIARLAQENFRLLDMVQDLQREKAALTEQIPPAETD